MTEVTTITALLTDMNKSLVVLHQDFGQLKGDVKSSLMETNGKLKGNQDLLTLRIDGMQENSKLQREVLSNQIETNKNAVSRNKNQIANIYELDRIATKRNDDANTKLLTDMNSLIDEKFKSIGDSLEIITANKIKINILFGATGALFLAIVVELFSRFKG